MPPPSPRDRPTELRRAKSRAGLLLVAAAALALYGIASRLPWPADSGHRIGVAAFAFLAGAIIVICGKFLYDTLFLPQNQYPGRFYQKDRR